MSDLTCDHNDCDGRLQEMPDDPSLPGYVDLYECPRCGEVYEYDGDAMEVDA